MMNLETLLMSLPPEQWQTRQAIVFDWFDGAREGLCALTRPAVEFRFQLVEERATEDDLDDRFFRVSELPAGSVDEVLGVLRGLGSPTGPVWVPLWRFSSELERQSSEQHIGEIEAQARPTPLVIQTPDLQHFLGCTRLPPVEDKRTNQLPHPGISTEQGREPHVDPTSSRVDGDGT